MTEPTYSEAPRESKYAAAHARGRSSSRGANRTENTTRSAAAGRVIARAFVGAGAIAAIAATATWLQTAPLPTVTASAASIQSQPLAGDVTRTCAGPLPRETSLEASESGMVLAGEAAIQLATADLAAQPLQPIFGAAAAPSSPGVISSPVVVRQASSSAAAALLSVAQSQSVVADGVSGYTASACTPPASEQWLVGGATDVGRATEITIANPGLVDATVSVRLWNQDGAVSLIGSPGQAAVPELTIAPGTSVYASITGLAPASTQIVAQVQASTGQVSAFMSQSITRVLQVSGSDQFAATASPETTQVIPGITLPTDAPVASPERVGDDLLPVVRIFSIAEQGDRVTVSVADTAGSEVLRRDVDLTPGAVADVALDGLPAGAYTATVTGASPVVAAARASSNDTSASDFAWLPAAVQLRDDQAFQVPPLAAGATARLAISADGSGAATQVTLTDGAGVPRTLDIPATGTQVVALDAQGSYSLSGLTGQRASVTISGDQALAAYPIVAADASATVVTVLP